MKRYMILLAVLCIAFNLSAATIDVICTNATVSTETLTSGDTKVSFAGLAEVAGQSKTVNLMVWNGNITTSATYASPDVYGAIGVVDVEGAGTIDVRADAITLTATLVGTDGNTYNVSMIHNNVETIVLTDMSITPGEEGSGYTYQLLAMGQAPIMGIAISLATATDYNGTFNVADLFADNSFIMFTNGNMVSFVNGSITISTAAGVTTLQANVLGSDGVQYAITMTSPILANTLDLLSTTLETAEDDGKLYMLGAAEDWSWALDLTIDGYAGYGEYTTVSGIYMDETADFEIEININKGRGYVSADENHQANDAIGVLAIDSIYTPIRNVKYSIDPYRVEQRTDYEKLTLEISTDGSITPQNALTEAAKLLIYHFMLFSEERIVIEDHSKPVDNALNEEHLKMRQLLNQRLIDMDLSVRALNCLKAAEVDTLGQLVKYHRSDLLKFRNFGKKSLTELDELLEKNGLAFGMDISRYKLND